MLYIVGLGPGAGEGMTLAAHRALSRCGAIVGYSAYIDLLEGLYPEARRVSTGMMREVERCRAALELARDGDEVALVCSGDAGVYGMAGLLLELAEEYPAMEIQVVPGITAAVSGAAVLGAPLIHDFAVISLSDLLTPWEKIERRLDRAAQADFVLCLYNPRSKRRADHLQKACDIVMRHQSPDTVCGTVRNIGREGQQSQVMTLRELRDAPVDMFTTVFIGNSATRRRGQYMVTPRGYENKKQ